MDWLAEDAEWNAAGLALALRLRADSRLQAGPGQGLRILHRWGEIVLDDPPAGARLLLERLAEGWLDRARIADLVLAQAAPAEVAALAARLGAQAQLLDRLSCALRYRLHAREQALCTIEPVSYAARLRPRPLPEVLRLSASVVARLRPEGMAIEAPSADFRIVLEARAAIDLALDLGHSGVDAAHLASPAARALAALLAAGGLLQGCEVPAASGFGPKLLAMAEEHDLGFHRKSRFGRHDGPFGAEFPFLGHHPPEPPIAPRHGEQGLRPLPVPSLEEVQHRDPTLVSTMERRHSTRVFARRPLALEGLGEWLFRIARTRGTYGPEPGMPYEACDRPYPSGGGVHDLELYLIVTDVEGLPPGAYRYAAEAHALEPLDAARAACEALIASALRASAAPAPPQVLVKIVSRFARIGWKYRAIAYATTLKNVGVLYQTMYLVTTAMRLGGCALGSGDDIAAQEAFGLVERSELSVGEFMLGIAADPPA